MPAASEPPRRTRAGVVPSFLDGWRRAFSAPVPVLMWLAATLALGSPLFLDVGGRLAATSDAVIGAVVGTAGWHADWAAGFGPRLDSPGILLYAGLWWFVSGGLLDRLARQRPLRTYQFFGISAVWAIRFLRLAVIVGPVYWALFRWLGDWMSGAMHERVLFALVFGLVNLVVDFAKVRAVVEDRHSMIGALAASARFATRRLFRVAALYGMNVAVLAIIVAAGPPAGPPGSPAWSLLFMQLYLLAHVWARLAFMASEVAFFQGELAHARYAASPLPPWPESASAEALGRLREQGPARPGLL